jgi:hypothetical protein
MKKRKNEVIIFQFNIGKPLTSVDIKIIKEILNSDYESDKYLMNILDSIIRDKEEFEKYLKLQELQKKQM